MRSTMMDGVLRMVPLLLAACATGCVPDPATDPCRGSGTWPAACQLDASSTRDGGAKSDAGVEPSDEAGATDAGLNDARVETMLDASGSVSDGSVGPEEDAAVPSDAGPPREPQVLTLDGDLGVHDPTIIRADGAFTIISTGRGLPVKRSSDLSGWRDEGRVFATNPTWIAAEVPGATDLWAPDIAYYGGKYHLYYSASTFGSRNSCIGHAVATDLSMLDFVDQGPVVCTEQSDDYNAIDPAFIVDENGTAWLSFGSFWSGIKLIRLDADGQREGAELHALASRDAVEAIEAPYLVRHGGYFYLFVSFDLCCRGSTSTYRIMVGRSEHVTGPYVDAEGTPMLSSGGGSSVVLGDQRWRGPGHNAVLTVGTSQHLVYHAYDAEQGGAPTLRISELLWDASGWPVPVGP